LFYARGGVVGLYLRRRVRNKKKKPKNDDDEDVSPADEKDYWEESALTDLNDMAGGWCVLWGEKGETSQR